jgi:hypothetical protein
MSESPRIWSVTSLESSQRAYLCEEMVGFDADVLQDEKALHLQALQEQVNAHYQRACICYILWRFLGSHVQNIKVEGARFVGLIVFIRSSGLSMFLILVNFGSLVTMILCPYGIVSSIE